MPPPQMSPPVQPLLSSHVAVLLVNWQPLLASQLSSVHGLPSTHWIAPPALHVPPPQTSPPVQTLPSVQIAVLLAWAHAPVLAVHESLVHTLPSSQLTATPGTHAPPLQTSPLVQPLPSLQIAVLLLCWQPASLSQLSLVHGLPSSQLSAPPATQLPPLQVSPTLHTLLSVHGAVLLVETQPWLGSQTSSVHGLLSLHTTFEPGTQPPDLHTSPEVHRLLSVQTAVLLMYWHPFSLPQLSSVHGLPSSQLTAVPATQLPLAQMSPVVHTLSSLHGAVLLADRQPC